MRTPGEGLLTPFTEQFQAPTAAQAAATPGYQFALQQGQEAINNSAAASDSFDQTTLSATAPGFTFQGTPTAGGKTYKVVRTCGP